jgi:acyl-coenzyme A thioesterase PaaI-like protein
MTTSYFQDTWPQNTCYGCGPGNTEGIQLKSHWAKDKNAVIATCHVDAKYNAGAPNMMYGGTIASLIDCHSLWTAIVFIHKEENKEICSPPTILCVTAELTVKYLKPTPVSSPIHLKAWIKGDIGKKTHVYCELGPAGEITATGDVIAIRIG